MVCLCEGASAVSVLRWGGDLGPSRTGEVRDQQQAAGAHPEQPGEEVGGEAAVLPAVLLPVQ